MQTQESPIPRNTALSRLLNAHRELESRSSIRQLMVERATAIEAKATSLLQQIEDQLGQGNKVIDLTDNSADALSATVDSIEAYARRLTLRHDALLLIHPLIQELRQLGYSIQSDLDLTRN